MGVPICPLSSVELEHLATNQGVGSSNLSVDATATLEIIGVLYTNRVIRYRAQTMHSHGIGAVKMTTLIVK